MGCSECDEYLSKKEYEYSIKLYGKALCRDCQKGFAPIKKKHQKKKKNSTPETIKLCKTLRKMGINAELEKYDGYKHIDIAIPEVKLNIEVDGMHHAYSHKQALSDLKRTFHSFKKGYVTIRIPNKLIKEKLYETAKFLKKLIEASEEQLEEEYDNFFFFNSTSKTFHQQGNCHLCRLCINHQIQ
jgi:very-short-patch-repair endonuclease